MKHKILDIFVKKITMYAIVIAMVFSMPGMGSIQAVHAAEINLATGTYSALIRPMHWTNEGGAGFRAIDISDRVLIESQGDSKNCTVAVKINGYSKYGAIYMLKQRHNDDIDFLAGSGDTHEDALHGLRTDKNKIGTNWTSFDGEELQGYTEPDIEKLKDANLNDWYRKLDKPDAQFVDEKTDSAIFHIQNVDINKKIGLVGYVGGFLSTGVKNGPICSSSFKIVARNIDDGNIPELAKGLGNTNAKLYPILTSAVKMRTETGDGYRRERRGVDRIANLSDKFANVEYAASPNNDGTPTITVSLEVTDEYKAKNPVFKKVEKRNADGEGILKEAYLSGNEGNEYSENLYKEGEHKVVLPLTYSEFLYGVAVLIKDDDERSYLGKLCFTEKDLGELKRIKDERTGIIYESNKDSITGNEELEVIEVTEEYVNSLPKPDMPEEIEEPYSPEIFDMFRQWGNKTYKTGALDSFRNMAANGKYHVYEVSIKQGGEYVNPGADGRLLIPIPENWETSKFYAESSSPWASNRHFPEDGMSIVKNAAGQNYFEVKDCGLKDPENCVVRKKSIINIAFAEVNKRVDVSELEEGVYEVRPDFLKAGTENIGSMAGGTLERKAYLVIRDDGSKAVYLNFKPINMGGVEAHMATLWNKTDADVTHFDYVTNDKGACISNAGFDPDTEFACLKSAKVTLSQDTYDAESFKYHFKVEPPAMGAGMPFEQVYNDPIDADLVFYNAKKLEALEEGQIPTFQKSVLRRSIDKAKKMQAADYTKDTYAKIAPVLKDGEEYYNTLAGKDAGTDKAISAEIEKKSKAIESAIKALKPVKDPTKPDPDKPKTESDLDIKTLKDGVYTVEGSMMKENKKSKSMADGAINHEVKLRVSDKKYELTLDFQGLHYLGKFGYLRDLRYFDNDYITNSYGTPTGNLKEVRVDNYQKDKNGKKLIDEYGTDYPNEVTFPMIERAKDDGYVPLQVFVPVMEAIGKETGRIGLGTQPVYLTLDLKSIRTGAPSKSDGGIGNTSNKLDEKPAEEKPLTPEELKKQEAKADEVLAKAHITDVSNHWAKRSIAYVIEKNLFKGASTTVKDGVTVTNFEPESNMTRSMVVAVLHRLAGTPAAGKTNMSDVEAGTWYENAVNWAVASKIVTGVGEHSFAPNQPITREAFVTMMYNYAKANDPKMNKTGDIGKFKDAAGVSNWSKDAISWAVGMGLLSGNDKGELSPAKTITRAEVASIFERYLKASEAQKAKDEKAKTDKKQSK